jgi:hypothetical protein
MGEEHELTYFFDDFVQLIKVAHEIFDLYADSIVQAKIMHAQVKETVFKQDDENDIVEKFMKALQGEEPTESEPANSTKHILALSLDKKAPVEEIDTCLWTSGGLVSEYDNEWYTMNAIEDLTYVSDRNMILDAFKHTIRKTIEKAGG